MDVGFGALDVVVQVVSEHVNQVDGVVPGIHVSVTREQDEGDVADPVTNSCVCPVEACRWVSTEKNLGCSGARSTPFFELLVNSKFENS